MFESFSTPTNRSRSLFLLLGCALLAVSAALIGIDDNLPGILLALVAAVAFVVAFTHPWQTARKYRRLLYLTAVCFVGFTLLNIFFDVIAPEPATGAQTPLRALASAIITAVSLLIAAGFLVSLGGMLTTFIRSRLRRVPKPPAVSG